MAVLNSRHCRLGASAAAPRARGEVIYRQKVEELIAALNQAKRPEVWLSRHTPVLRFRTAKGLPMAGVAGAARRLGTTNE
jgi:hypothetical protein